ncbi:hypothetical protein ACTDI4_05440 [Mesorhizobium sp. PUT5]|uniref:hypothetical protein n=1 Tax=Mesorhizobium sp. PUT5 TaxID=3454629 RepID=UPI003FA443EB
MDKINRRSALAVTGAGLTAALAGVSASVAATAEPQPSPIMGLFREWEAKYAQTSDPAPSDEEVDRILDECRELERRMLAIPASSAGDFAAKLLAITSYGQYSLEDDAGGSFMAEARALAGVEAAAERLNT